MAANLLLIASDKPEKVLEILKTDPSRAKDQDESGYSLLHAAASYGHLTLLRELVSEYKVDVNLLDDDHETCLFVAETEAIARCLIEELHIDLSIRNNQGQSALERQKEEGDFPEVVQYLRSQTFGHSSIPSTESASPSEIPLTFTTVEGTDEAEAGVVDEDLKKRIDELVEGGDLQSEHSQQQFRELVADVVRTHVTDSGPDDRPRKARS